MPLLEWSPLLSTGIESIDKQHKVLLGLVNELNDALEEGTSDKHLKQIFDKLVLYTENHFMYEEELFEQYDFPLAKQHTEEHQQLSNELYALKDKMENNDFMISIELMGFLKEWLAEHILGSDMAYSEHMLSHGVK